LGWALGVHRGRNGSRPVTASAATMAVVAQVVAVELEGEEERV